jgi:hypothetical protein
MTDMNELNKLGGWEHRPDTISLIMAAFDVRRFWDAHLELKGCHKNKVVLLHKPFHDKLGANQEYRNQTIGNCVGRGGARTIDIVQCFRGLYDYYALSAGAYGGARYEIGYEEYGSRASIRGDGAVVAYMVECLVKLGALKATKYEVSGKVYDFTGRHDDDSLDREWGQRGIPDELEPSMERMKADGFYQIVEGEEMMDAIASGHCGVFGTSLAHWTSLPARRDAKGFLRLRGTTAHCWIATGSVDDGGTTGLVLDNRSWGNDWVEGPEGPYPLGPGRYLSRPEDFTKLVSRGEAYCISAFGNDPAPPDKIDWITL